MGQSHADDEGDDKVIAAIVALDRAKLVLEIVYHDSQGLLVEPDVVEGAALIPEEVELSGAEQRKALTRHVGCSSYSCFLCCGRPASMGSKNR